MRMQGNVNQLTAAKEKLELFYEQKTKGIIIRATFLI